MPLAPNKQNISDIIISSLWSLIAWIIWSLLIIIISFTLANSLDIVNTFQTAKIWLKASPIFPLVLSLITLFWTTVTSFLTYYIWNMTNSEKYKKNIIIFWQIAFFQILTYIFLAPIYIYTGMINYDNIMNIYIFHVLISIFWTSIILEILNNYKYVLIWVYWSFVWLFFSTIFSIYIFIWFTSWYAKLIILVLLLPIINFLITFFKQLFELMYYYYYNITWMDQLWDIFYQIENEENEKERIEEEKNFI
jgi:hypothetical protein